MTTDVDGFFTFQHLSPDLQQVSKPIADLASLMDQILPDGSEKSAGMRKLLEAKDCFVRAAVEKGLIAEVEQPQQSACEFGSQTVE